jgi:hypothetical protein
MEGMIMNTYGNALLTKAFLTVNDVKEAAEQPYALHEKISSLEDFAATITSNIPTWQRQRDAHTLSALNYINAACDEIIQNLDANEELKNDASISWSFARLLKTIERPKDALEYFSTTLASSSFGENDNDESLLLKDIATTYADLYEKTGNSTYALIAKDMSDICDNPSHGQEILNTLSNIKQYVDNNTLHIDRKKVRKEITIGQISSDRDGFLKLSYT